MDERTWIGPAERAPVGWTVSPSLDVFLGSRLPPRRIVLDDPAAVLREADFLKVYSHSPLAQIVRRIGPWRAGVGRTDPVWPRATTQASDPCPLDQPSDWSEVPPPLPMTADYDELAATLVAQPVCLKGVICWVQIADRELRKMWEETLRLAGAEVLAMPNSAQVWVLDEWYGSDHEATEVLCVRLTTAPWLVAPSASEVAFSTSDSPWSVMQHIGQRLKRGDRELA